VGREARNPSAFLTLRRGADYAEAVPKLIATAVVALAVLMCGPAWAQPKKVKEAAQQFERGQALYNKGQYVEAIRAFTKANAISPHPSALFNIARCHENLGDAVKALQVYQEALAATTDPATRADIQARMKRLAARPVKVFVSSKPSGATVTVDGRASAEPTKTPIVLRLTPGEHVLLVRLEGHHLEARRIAVEMDKELPVEVQLQPLPAPCPPPPPPCPPPRKCPPPEQLVDGRNLHLHLSVMGAFALTSARPVTGGPGVQLHATYRRVVFGAHFLGMPMGEEQIEQIITKNNTTITYNRAVFRWLLAQVEGGYLFPFRRFYLYTTFGVGLSADRITFYGKDDTDKQISGVNEGFALVWSVGGGIEAMALKWLSLGAAIRGGALHGKRVAKDRPSDDPELTNAPYGSLWGTVTLHL
jgi:hypothetical protein